jgi:hypothetical protein
MATINFGIFILEQKIRVIGKVGTFFFKKEPFFHNSIKRKPNPSYTLYLGRNHFYQKGITALIF